MFHFHLIICVWKLDLIGVVISVRSKRLFNCQDFWGSRDYLTTRIDDFGSKGQIFSHIQELNIRFITDLRNMTYNHFLAQPKSMLEWELIRNISRNPDLIGIFENTSHLLIRK